MDSQRCPELTVKRLPGQVGWEADAGLFLPGTRWTAGSPRLLGRERSEHSVLCLCLSSVLVCLSVSLPLELLTPFVLTVVVWGL